VTEGQKLRLAGRGETGSGGGAAGDLYLRVRLAKHPDFEVEDHNLIYEAELAPWEAVLGANLSVPALDGRVNIKIPAGTQGGKNFACAPAACRPATARAMPSPGRPNAATSMVITRIAVPAKITTRRKNCGNSSRESNSIREGDEQVAAWAKTDFEIPRRAGFAAEQRRTHQPQRAALGNSRAGIFRRD
jgi:DnaJ-class molecular chaperone